MKSNTLSEAEENKRTKIFKGEPLMRIVSHTEVSERKAIVLRILAVVSALVAGGIFILALGHNPFKVYYNMIAACLGSVMSIQETVKISIPLILCSLGVTLAFKMRFWNIGAEGQLIMGAIVASYFALYQSEMPHILLMLIMAATGIIAGGLWGTIPAILKAKFGTNETLLTLMMNYVALYVVQYLREGPWKDPASKGFLQIARFSKNARLDTLLGVHIGWVIALILVAGVYVYLRYTKQGYEISVVGESENTANYAGMNVKKIIVRTMFIGGAICGLAGMLQASGADKTLTESVAGGVGFTAIIVAWLANLNAIAILFVSLLFAILSKGSGFIQSMFNISPSAADVLQGIILFFVLGFEFFIRYKVVFRKGRK